MAEPEQRVINHIVGSAATQRTAVLLTEYIRARFQSPHTRYPAEAFSYREDRDLTGKTRHYDILVTDGEFGMDHEYEILEAVRGFLAGIGDRDIWG